MEQIITAKKNSFTSPAKADKAISMIDKLNLGATVRELRSQGLSYLNVAKRLNGLPELQGRPLRAMTVQRWCKNNIVQELDVEKKDEILNLYNENRRLLESVESHIEMIDVFREDLTTKIEQTDNVQELYDDLMKLYKDTDRFYARKQLILQQMGQLQDKVYNLQTLSDIIQEILAIVERKDETVYKEIIEEMRNNRILLSAYEKVKNFSKDL